MPGSAAFGTVRQLHDHAPKSVGQVHLLPVDLPRAGRIKHVQQSRDDSAVPKGLHAGLLVGFFGRLVDGRVGSVKYVGRAIL